MTGPHESINRVEMWNSPIRGKNQNVHVRNSRLEEQAWQSDKNRGESVPKCRKRAELMV